MADDCVSEVIAGIRAALMADAALVALVADRVVEAPEDGIAFPYVTFGEVTPRADDTDGTRGHIVAVGLIAHSRPLSGRGEAARICQALADALHRAPEAVTVTGYHVSEVEVLTWLVDRAGDGASYEGRLALQVSLDA